MKMKKLHHILSVIAVALLLPSTALAQDARQRTPVTIVADVLAEIPYGQRADFDTAMSDLLGTGTYGVTQLASQLVPAGQGENNRVEYALDGLTAYASSHATPSQLAAVREGLVTAINNCHDTPNKAFLMSLLSRVSRPEDAQFFANFLTDSTLTEAAQSALILTPGTDEFVAALVEQGELPYEMLARMAGAKKLSQCERTLINWTKGPGRTFMLAVGYRGIGTYVPVKTNSITARKANDQELPSIYKALALLGTTKSLPVLAKAAAKEDYKWLPTDATAAYVELLNRLSTDPANENKVASAASGLMKKTKDSHVRSGAMTALFNARQRKAAKTLYKALTDPDRQYRVAALRACQPWADEEVYTRIAAIAINGQTPLQVKTDIVNWLGTNNATDYGYAVTANITARDEELSKAAIRAAGRIGGEAMLDALITQLDGPRATDATDALLAFNGSVDRAIVDAMNNGNASETTLRNALNIVAQRKIKDASPIALKLLDSDNPRLADAAYDALPGVVAANDIKVVSQRLETAPQPRVAALQDALLATVGQLPADKRYDAINSIIKTSSKPQRYYTALAATGSADAIRTLSEAYAVPSTSDAALAALLQVDSPQVMETLFEIATTNDKANARALTRFADLTARYGDTPVKRYQQYRRAIEASKSADVDNQLLGRLAETGTYPALMIADRYIAREANANAAAAAIRSIMSKHIDEYAGDEVRDALVKAADVFKADKYNADAGYAVDDINGMLAKLDARGLTEPSSRLTDEEIAEGFEMLFDGTSMSKWTGDTATYIMRDGCITVKAAHWGNNIYTIDQFDNFVLRFEFSLDRPGVNNGVGIRTPMNVDAAFHGMEIQILDHDDPMYANLEPYQVHGKNKIRHHP